MFEIYLCLSNGMLLVHPSRVPDKTCCSGAYLNTSQLYTFDYLYHLFCRVVLVGKKNPFLSKSNLKLCIELVSFVNLFVSCLIWACKISCRKNIPVGVLPFFSFIKILNGQPFKKTEGCMSSLHCMKMNR